MLPMISSLQEFRQAQQLIESAEAELKREGSQNRHAGNRRDD